MISLLWEKRAIPLYWQLLDKRGSSNLSEQQALITPILELLKDYEIILLGDREFGSVKLAQWLNEREVKFVFRIKQERYIQAEGENFTHLSQLGLLPGTSFYLSDVKVTKQKGFGKFNVAAYWRRKYRRKQEQEGWYRLTNLNSFKQAITEFKHRSGIVGDSLPSGIAMFKDCKTGGYNLEKCHASQQRLQQFATL